MNYKETVDSIFNGNFGGIVLTSNDVDGLSKEVIDNLFSKKCNGSLMTKIDNLLIYFVSLDKINEEDVFNIMLKFMESEEFRRIVPKSYEFINFNRKYSKTFIKKIHENEEK